MNPTESASFYAMAQQMDQRMDRELSEQGAVLWAEILKPVPFREAKDILVRLYSSRQNSILQPGTVLEVWEGIRVERRKIVEQVHSIDRYLTIESDPHVIEEKQQRRAELIEKLPAHVVEYAGIGQQQLNPPPKYKRKSREVTSIDFGGALKKV